MKIGVFTPLFGQLSLDETLDLVAAEGIEAVELGAGAYPGAAHLEVEKLLSSASARKELLRKVESRGLMISAISVHGNPLHPNKRLAKQHHEAFVRAVRLSDALGVNKLNGFSGCPGDCETAKNPNWVTCAWPDEFRDILDWQWDEKVIPYWKEQAKLLAKHQVQFGIEMHPGFVVYNKETFHWLREGVGKNGRWIGVNFDPSHLWWQGIDPLLCLEALALHDAVFHVHAKDLKINPLASALHGNLDTKSYADIRGRAWSFRSVGYGHPVDWWRDFVSTLRTAGYDYVLSIEHEDGLMSPLEGLRKAVATLKDAIIVDPPGEMFWVKG